jgi:hypothetical protein
MTNKHRGSVFDPDEMGVADQAKRWPRLLKALRELREPQPK